LRWRALGIALLIALTCELPAALAQGRARPVRIGGLTVSWGWTPGFVGLREGLLELGYREGEDFVIGVRFTGGDVAGFEAAARDLLTQGADILVAGEGDSALAALAATTQIPIVMITGGDPVRRGLAHSYARPGGNLTGVTDLDLELAAKRLEMFRQIVPGLRRVLFAYDSADRYSGAEAAAYRDGAHRLGLTLVERPIRGRVAAEALFSQLQRGEVDGMLGPNSLTSNIPGLVLEAASRLAVPSMFMGSFYVERGGLANYGPNWHASGRQAARLVDKIIKGIKPATIPIEVSSKIEFAINLKTAKVLGLTIPREVLYQADRIIR
jgi:putative ABC transport system substrate-binding protein